MQNINSHHGRYMQLYFSLGLILCCDNTCGLVRFRHQNDMVKVRSWMCFGLLVLSPPTQLEIVPISNQKYQLLLPQSRQEHVPLSVPQKYPVVNIETQLRTVVFRLSAILPRHYVTTVPSMSYYSIRVMKMCQATHFESQLLKCGNLVSGLKL